MDKKLKEQLKSAFETPAPERKDEFLRSLNFPKLSRLDFIISQICYIRKTAWILSCLLAAAGLFVLNYYAGNNSLYAIGVLSALLPFVSLLIITEFARSISYNMAELEMSCRYNLSDIVLVRLGVLGGLNFLFICLLIMSMIGKSDFGILRFSLYFFTPFLLTCWLSFFTFNRFKPKEATYICGGISCCVSMSCVFYAKAYTSILFNNQMQLWGIAFFILLLCFIKEAVKLIKRTEEMQWSLL